MSEMEDPMTVGATLRQFVDMAEARARKGGFPTMVRAEMRKPSDVSGDPRQDPYAALLMKLTTDERAELARLLEKMA